MTTSTKIDIGWRPRLAPLTPVGVAAAGITATKLARRLCELDSEVLGSLRGAAGRGLIIVLGEEQSLPWVDGVVYLGRDKDAPSLLLPTTIEPDIPIELFERALMTRVNRPPLAVLVSPPVVAPIGLARPITREHLTRWLEIENATGEPGASRLDNSGIAPPNSTSTTPSED